MQTMYIVCVCVCGGGCILYRYMKEAITGELNDTTS